MTRTAGSLGLLAIIVVGLAGCSKPLRTEDPDTTNLRRIYQAFKLCEDFKRRGPKDAEELKHWLGELGEPGTPEEFVISRRDKQPFVIFYGHTIHPTGGEVVLVHEKDGVEGKRFVLTLGGNVKALSDEEFAKARFAGKKADGKS
jgi:hypothetical protein